MHTRRIVDDETFRRLCRARDYAHAYFASPIDTRILAEEAALSTWHFHRLFTGTFGATPHDTVPSRARKAVRTPPPPAGPQV